MQTECIEARIAASLSLCPRVGVLVPKYGHNIVDRNKTKRRLRELTRVRVLPVLGPVDLLLRAKPQAYQASFEHLATQIDSITDWASSSVA
jgi:ribonuclease P protein component